MRKDTRFNRLPREEVIQKLPPDALSDSQALGVFNMMYQSDDPSEVCHWYRSFRDSSHCSLSKNNIRAIRDAVIESMREANSLDPSKRVEKKRGVHYDNPDSSGFSKSRTGA